MNKICRRGTYRIRHTSYDERNDHDEHRPRQRQRFIAERDDERNADNRTGNDIRDHRNGIDQIVPEIGTAHDEVRDKDRKQNNDEQREAAYEQRIGKRTEQEPSGRSTVAVERKARFEHSHIAFFKRQIDDIELRQKRKRNDEIAICVHQNTAEQSGIFLLYGVQRVDRKFEFIRAPLLQCKHERRDDNCDDADRRRKMKIGSVFAEVLIVYLHRERPESFAEQKRRSEIRERSHKHEQRCCENRRHTEPQNDFEQTVYADTAEVCGCFEQTVIDVFKRAVHIDKHERKQFKRFDEDDAAHTVDAAEHFYVQRVFQKNGEHARPAEQQNPRVRADKGSRHTAQNTQNENRLRAF